MGNAEGRHYYMGFDRWKILGISIWRLEISLSWPLLCGVFSAGPRQQLLCAMVASVTQKRPMMHVWTIDPWCASCAQRHSGVAWSRGFGHHSESDVLCPGRLGDDPGVVRSSLQC